MPTAHRTYTLTDIAKCIALAAAIALGLDGLCTIGGLFLSLSSEPTVSYGWCTRTLSGLAAIVGVLQVGVAYRLWGFSRSIESAPGHALRGLARAAWIYAVIRVLAIAIDVVNAGELSMRLRMISESGNVVGPTMSEILLEPIRIALVVINLVCVVLTVWVARTTTRASESWPQSLEQALQPS